MSLHEVENIGPPPAPRSSARNAKYHFEEISLGASRLHEYADDRERMSLQVAAHAFARRKGVRFVTRREGKGKIRIYRVALDFNT